MFLGGQGLLSSCGWRVRSGAGFWNATSVSRHVVLPTDTVSRRVGVRSHVARLPSSQSCDKAAACSFGSLAGTLRTVPGASRTVAVSDSVLALVLVMFGLHTTAPADEQVVV